MKTLVSHIYSYAELSDEAKARAIESLRTRASEDPFILDGPLSDMVDSLKSIAEACGFTLSRYSIGPYNRSSGCTISGYDAYDEGHKATARFLRVLVEHGYKRPKRFTEMEFPGVCGFTGVCYDDDVAETVWQALLQGDSFASAFNQAADHLSRASEDELDYITSEESVREYLDEDEEQFNEDGTLA